MRYEVDEYAIGEPWPKESFSKDTPAVWRATKRQTFDNIVVPHVIQELNHPTDPWTGWPMPRRSRTFTREEFEEKYGDRLEYDPHMTEDAARYILQRRNGKEFNDYIISQGKGGIVESVGKFGIETAISMIDPSTLAACMIPIPGSSAIAKLGGQFAKYVYQGVAGGLIGGVVSEPLHAHTANIMQDEYSWQDAAQNIGMSAVTGGMLGGGIYGLMKAGSKLKGITQKYKEIKSNNAIIALELDKNTDSVIHNNTHPSGIKENVIPLEELWRQKSELIDQQHSLFPEYSGLENKIAIMETNLHQEYHTNGNLGHIPNKKLAKLIPEEEALNQIRQNHSGNEQFQSIMQERANLDREIHETLKKIQYDTNSYNLSPEDLHIARSQIQDGKVIDLADPHNALSIHEAYPENVVFRKVDDELQASYGKKLQSINLDDLEVRSKAIDDIKYKTNSEFIKSHKSAKVGCEQLLRKTEIRQQTISRKYLCDFVLDLEKNNLAHHFEEMKGSTFLPRNKKLELDVARELANISLQAHPQGFTNSNLATRLAQILYKHQKKAVDNANQVGANISWLKGYVTRQTHEPSVLKKMGFEKWRDFILPLLDLDHTNAVDLYPMYKNLVTDLHLEKTSNNIAKQLGEGRKLHFKSADAWYKYNEQCGQYGLVDSVQMNLERLGNRTALIEGLGANPRNHLTKLKESVLTELQDGASKSEAIATNDFNYVKSKSLDNILTHMIGSSPVNLNLARIAQNTRTLKMMGSLGKMLLSTVPDLAIAAQEVNYSNNLGLLRNFAKTLYQMTKPFDAKKKKEFAKLLGIGSNSMLGGIYQRLNADSPMPGVLSKMTNVYFKFNGMEWWDSTLKIAVGDMLSSNLANQASKPWKQLDNGFKIILNKYGITQNNWKYIKTLKGKVHGNDYIIPDDSDLGKAVGAYIFDRIDHAVISPNAKEKAFMFGDTQAGTVVGEALRFMFQFKQFPTVYVNRALRAATIDKIPLTEQSGIISKDLGRSFMETDAIKSALSLLLGTTALGYPVIWARAILDGEEVPSIEENPMKVIGACMSYGGGLGIVGEYIFKDYDRYGKNILFQVAGPVLGDVGKAVGATSSIVSKAMNDEMTPEELWKQLRFLQTYIPAQNLFYARPAFDTALRAASEEN